MSLDMAPRPSPGRRRDEERADRRRRNRAEFHLGRLRAAADPRDRLRFAFDYLWAVGMNLPYDRMEEMSDVVVELANDWVGESR